MRPKLTLVTRAPAPKGPAPLLYAVGLALTFAACCLMLSALFMIG